MTDEEQFYAWLDGELDGDAAARVAARVAGDPALSELAERHRKLGSRLRASFAPVMQDTTPPQFGAGRLVDLNAARSARKYRRTSFGVPQWAAMAATLAIGIVAGRFVGDLPGQPIENRDGVLVAAAPLDRALDRQLASAGAGGSVRVGLTFRDRSGRICRSFVDEGSSGLACRNGDRWRIEGLFSADSDGRGDFRMAAGEDPQLAALIDDRIAGEPFDAAAEKAALERGWR